MIQFVKLVTVTCLISAVSCFAANAGNTIKVYKWVDQNGITHFDQTPPAATEKEIIKLSKTQSSADSTAATATKSSGASTSTAAKTDKTSDSTPKVKDKENCEIAKKNSDILKNYTRIKVTDEKGEYRYLTDDEKQQRLAEASKMISDNCD